MKTKKPPRPRDPFDPTWKVNPDTRTMRFLSLEGWTAGVVEQAIHGTFIKRDFLGIADIVAVKPGLILAIQATADTTGGNSYRRMEKCAASPNLRAWAEAGGVFAVWSWSIRKAKGEKSRVTLRRWTAVFRPTGLDWIESEERSS
jgi:hypothetical protein